MAGRLRLFRRSSKSDHSGRIYDETGSRVAGAHHRLVRNAFAGAIGIGDVGTDRFNAVRFGRVVDNDLLGFLSYGFQRPGRSASGHADLHEFGLDCLWNWRRVWGNVFRFGRIVIRVFGSDVVE